MPSFRIVPAATVGLALELEPLARTIFGSGDRPAGWFARKLRRECIDLSLSPVALASKGSADDPLTRWGYVLVGTPASRQGRVRTGGTGVVASARGHGIGTALLNTAARDCRVSGYRCMELLADHRTQGFYERRGFRLVRPTLTVLAFARGDAPVLDPPQAWRPLESDEVEPVVWLPETWSGTERSATVGLHWIRGEGPVFVWLTREGVAWLVQRLVCPRRASWPTVATELLERLPAETPVILPLLNPEHSSTQALLKADWSEIQRGAWLERWL